MTFTTTRGKPTGKTLNMVTRDDRFNDLYAIVTEEYENWDEGRTVDWVKVEKAIANYTLTSYEEYRRITKGVKLNEVQKNA